MASKMALFSGAVAGVVLACGPADAQTRGGKNRHPARPSPMEQKVEALSESVRALEARLDQEAKAREALQAQAQAATDAAAASRAEAQAARAELADQIKTIPGVVDTAVTAKTAHPSFIPFKGVTITPGGFLAAEGIYRSKNDVSDISSNFSRIPFKNSPLAHGHELRGTARQTRLSLLVQGDINPDLHAAFYGEFDFQAAAQTANSNESNSFNPRLRHIYATLDWDSLGLHLLAGQNWSLATLNAKGITPRNEVPPLTIDGQYLPGFVWARQPQLRLVKDWNKSIWAAVSLENPQTSFAGLATGISSTAAGISVLSVTPGATGFDANNNISLNRVPDIIGKVAYEPMMFGGRPLHVEIFGLWRNYYARVNAAPGNAAGVAPGTFNADVDGGGVGGSITASVLPGRLDLQGSILKGRGLGRYGSGQLPDVTLRPDGSIASIPETLYMVGGTWHATPELDVYVYAGEERQDRQSYDLGGNHFGFGNPAATFTAAGCTIEGGICTPNLRKISQITAGAWHKPFTGTWGQIRIGVQYSHTKLTGFSGADGFVPKTSADMIFTSFRYYLP